MRLPRTVPAGLRHGHLVRGSRLDVVRLEIGALSDRPEHRRDLALLRSNEQFLETALDAYNDYLAEVPACDRE